jgi:hypothetical protein
VKIALLIVALLDVGYRLFVRGPLRRSLGIVIR